MSRKRRSHRRLHAPVSRQITAVLGVTLKDYNDYLIEETAKIVAKLQDDFDDKIAILKGKHDSDIGALQNEIRELKVKSKRGRGPRGAKGEKGTAPAFHSWSIDAERFRVTGFFTDGTSTPHLDLMPLFRSYFNQTSEQ